MARFGTGVVAKRGLLCAILASSLTSCITHGALKSIKSKNDVQEIAIQRPSENEVVLQFKVHREGTVWSKCAVDRSDALRKKIDCEDRDTVPPESITDASRPLLRLKRADASNYDYRDWQKMEPGLAGWILPPDKIWYFEDPARTEPTEFALHVPTLINANGYASFKKNSAMVFIKKALITPPALAADAVTLPVQVLIGIWMKRTFGKGLSF